MFTIFARFERWLCSVLVDKHASKGENKWNSFLFGFVMGGDRGWRYWSLSRCGQMEGVRVDRSGCAIVA